MRKLDTRALELFLTVADCLNFRQAAERLHMTQPPLTRAIQKLESQLGLRLFERDTQGVSLTPAGRKLLPHARKILQNLDAAEQALRGVSRPARRALRIGLTTSVEAGTFTPLLADFAGDTPPSLTFAPSPQLVASLRAGRLDAAILALPARTFELTVRPLGKQAMMAALPARHPLARRRLLALADLAEEPVYWFERSRQPAFFDHCMAIFDRHGFHPDFLREPDDHHVLLADIAAGKGIALLPESFAALKLQGVVYRTLREGQELALTLGLAHRPDAPLP
ncbi:MAG TPA: LysR family transcriptional regulator [Pseudoduganella sp.]